MYTTTLVLDTRINGELTPAGTRIEIDDPRYPGHARSLRGGRWTPVDEDRLSIEDLEDTTMTFQQALDTIINRREVQETHDAQTGSDLVFNAVHLVVVEVRGLCATDTDGIGDWIENGSYTGAETPQSIAAEWDSLRN